MTSLRVLLSACLVFTAILGTRGTTDEEGKSDLILTLNQVDAFFGVSDESRVIDDRTIRKWPNGILYYEMDPLFTKKQVDIIRTGFKEIEHFTCIKFQQRTASDHGYVFIQANDSRGCSSFLGKLGGRQPLNLASGCVQNGIVIHELLHALGTIHEHNHHNRDDFVDIMWDSIQKGVAYNFYRYKKGTYLTMGVPYSFRSVMHYSRMAFSRDWNETIVAKDPIKSLEMGNRRGLDYKDVMFLNKLYQCAALAGCQDHNKCRFDGHLDKNCQCICDDGSDKCDNTKRKKQVTDFNCRNKYHSDWECSRSALFNQCELDKAWVPRYCEKACGLCGTGTSTTGRPTGTRTTASPGKECKNNYDDIDCANFAKRGDCGKSWTIKYCPKACNLC